METAEEIYESLVEYLSGFIKGVSYVGFDMRQNCVIKFEKICDIISGLDWIDKALISIKKQYNLNDLDYDFKSIFLNLEQGLSLTDEIFLADILEYDILDTLEDIYGKIGLLTKKLEGSSFKLPQGISSLNPINNGTNVPLL